MNPALRISTALPRNSTHRIDSGVEFRVNPPAPSAGAVVRGLRITPVSRGSRNTPN